jgi:hypothetical protein
MPAAGPRLILTNKSNAERDALNAAAQRRRRAAGELGHIGVRLSPAAHRFHLNDRVIYPRAVRAKRVRDHAQNPSSAHWSAWKRRSKAFRDPAGVPGPGRVSQGVFMRRPPP